MPGLLDIARVAEKVTVQGGVELEVLGVDAGGIAVLMDRFPSLRALMSERQIDQHVLMRQAPEVVNAIIAAGCGSPGSTEHEEAAGRLNAESQLVVLSAILKLTMPSGIGPFVKRLGEVALRFKGAPPARPGRARATKSPRQSKR